MAWNPVTPITVRTSDALMLFNHILSGADSKHVTVVQKMQELKFPNAYTLFVAEQFHRGQLRVVVCTVTLRLQYLSRHIIVGQTRKDIYGTIK